MIKLENFSLSFMLSSCCLRRVSTFWSDSFERVPNSLNDDIPLRFMNIAVETPKTPKHNKVPYPNALAAIIAE